jgi:hypothetical protein
MGNPYYVPRDNSNFANALSVLKLGLDAYGTYNQDQQASRRNDLSEKELLMRGDERRDTRDFQRQTLAGQQEDRAANRSFQSQQIAQKDRTTPEHQRQWGPLEAGQVKKLFEDFGFKDKDGTVNPALDAMAKDPSVTKGDAYGMFKQEYPALKEKVLGEAVDNYVSKLDKPGFMGSKEQQKLLKGIETLQNDLDGTMVDKLFGKTVASLEAEKATAAKEATTALPTSDQIIGQLGQAVATGKLSPEAARQVISVMKPEALLTFDKVVAGLVTSGKRTVEEASKLLHPSAGGQQTSTTVTEKGSFPIWQDPNTQTFIVKKPDGEQAIYDPKIHGKQVSKSTSSTAIYMQNNKVEGEAKIDARAKQIGDEIIAGRQPPQISGFGMSKITPQIKAYLAEKGFDLTSAESDWIATKKHVQSMNSTQQLRLMQAVTFTRESIPIIRELATEWDAGGFAPLNSVNLLAARNGVYGKQAMSVATRMEAQIADLTSELGTVYKGGNSSTDESLKLAAQNIKAKWSADVLSDNLDQIEKNLVLRENSMKHSVPKAMSGKSPLSNQTPAATPTAPGRLQPEPKSNLPAGFKKGW